MSGTSLHSIPLILLCLLLGRTASFTQSDTTLLFYGEYVKNIAQHHPIAKNADLRIDFARAEMMRAKGNLDPTIQSDWKEKNFDDLLYYRQYQSSISIPTVLGIDLTGGYENSEGVFLNPEQSTDEFGLWHVGIEVNILQGLWINERRTALDLAENFQALATFEQRIILNDLLYDASDAYLNWQQYAYMDSVLAENETLANIYFQNTKISFQNGEQSAIDTLEAFIAYQDAVARRQNNEMALIKYIRSVENYLWNNQTPVALLPTAIPEQYDNDLFVTFKPLDEVDVSGHPIIMSQVNELTALEIEQRLKREKLKPQLKVGYNPLLATDADGLTPNFSTNDFQWGFDFSVPIFLRSERGAVQQGEVMILEAEMDLLNKRNELENKIQASWEQQEMLIAQLDLLNDNVENYRILLEAENEKFRFGESSVFLLNRRQEKYINGQIKLIKTYIQRQRMLLDYLYYSNQLVE